MYPKVKLLNPIKDNAAVRINFVSPDCLLVLNATASSGLIKPVLNVVTIKGKR